MVNTVTASHRCRDPAEISLVSIFTFVLWTSCALVGILGLWIPYPHPHAGERQPPPVIAQRITVDISQEFSTPQVKESVIAAPAVAQPPKMPPLPTMAAPNPAAAVVALVPTP